MTGKRRIEIVIGLLIALGLPFCHLGDLGRLLLGRDNLFGGEILWGLLFAIIVAWVLAVERRPLSSIGYRTPKISDLALGVAAAIIMFLGTGILFQVVLPALHLSVAQKIGALVATPLWFRLLNVSRAAFAEETAFRGYGFERLTELTGSRLIAAVVTFALFTLVHLSGGGWGQVIIAAWGGLVLTLLYLWRRNLWANILAHWLTDAGGFILVPLLMAHHH